MFTHTNPSLSSITSEELRWLDADAQILQDSSFFDASSSPTNLHNPCPLPSASNDPLPIPRVKVIPARHHYQRSTKSSSAKAVIPNRISSSLAPKRSNHPNLRSTATPTPLSTPSLSNSSLPSLSNHSDFTSSTDSIITTPRLAKRSHSPTSTPPRSPEWIYRRPKSPTTPPASIRRRPEMNRSANEPSATSQSSTSYFSEISSSSSSLPSPNFSYSEPPESPTLWTSLLRPRKRSGSVASKSSANTCDIPSLWFGADDTAASRPGPSSSSRFLKSKSSLTSPPLSRSSSQSSIGPINKSAIRVQRNRSSSVSSTISSISTSTTSSLPLTPNSPSFSPSIMKKFKPNHQCIVEDVEPESEPEDKLMGLGPNISIRRKESSSSSSDNIFISPKRRLKLDTSSNKSVKFVETPTVHYASAGYEPGFWHIPGESMDTDDAIDTDQMDIENEANTATETGGHISQVPIISHPYAYAQSPYRMNVDEQPSKVHLRYYRPEDRELLCVTPTPDSVRGGRGLKRIVSKSIKRQASSGSSWRSAPSSSPSRSVTPRPAISGPFVLGSASTVPSLHSASPYTTSRSQFRSKIVSSGIALRSAPSLESFRSVKSSAKSVRSMRSLKSLPESVKSSIEVGAREMKEWFKGRISIGVGSL